MTPPRRVLPAAVFALVAGFLLLRAALFSVTTASEYALYFEYARAVRDSSLAELHRAREVEYPPLATLFGLAVVHVAELLPEGTERLTVWRPEETHGPVSARYEVALGIVLFAVDVACLGLVYATSRRIYPEDGPWKRIGRLGVYVAATSAIGLIYFDRQDPVVALVAALAMTAFAWGAPRAAYAILAIGTGYKLVPMLLLPVFVLAAVALRAAPRSTGGFLRAAVLEALLAGVMLAAVPVATYAWCGGDRAFTFLSFHSKRGLQVEASPAWVVVLVDGSTQLGHSYGSYTLRGTLADRVAELSTFATAGILVFSVLIASHGFHRAATAAHPPDPAKLTTHLVAGSLLTWLGFILTGKVGSPQYLLWLAPLVPLLPLRGSQWSWTALLVAGMMVTTLIYPCQYALVKGTPTGEVLTWTGPTTFGLVMLAARAIIYSIAFVWLAAMVWRAKWLS